MNRERFRKLNIKIRTQAATSGDKLEFMSILQENKHITQEQYNNYNAGIRSEELLKIGRIIGGALVLTWAIEKITDGQQ